MLEKQLQEDLSSAMKLRSSTGDEKYAVEVSALRAIKAAIQNEKVNGTYHEVSDSDIVSIIQKLSKQRAEP